MLKSIVVLFSRLDDDLFIFLLFVQPFQPAERVKLPVLMFDLPLFLFLCFPFSILVMSLSSFSTDIPQSVEEWNDVVSTRKPAAGENTERRCTRLWDMSNHGMWITSLWITTNKRIVMKDKSKERKQAYVPLMFRMRWKWNEEDKHTTVRCIGGTSESASRSGFLRRSWTKNSAVAREKSKSGAREQINPGQKASGSRTTSYHCVEKQSTQWSWTGKHQQSMTTRKIPEFEYYYRLSVFHYQFLHTDKHPHFALNNIKRDRSGARRKEEREQNMLIIAAKAKAMKTTQSMRNKNTRQKQNIKYSIKWYKAKTSLWTVLVFYEITAR